MQFLIPLRNAVTGEEKNFHNKQQIADFLASRDDDADWEGHACLGQLPEPTPAGEVPIEPVPVETPEQAEALKQEANAPVEPAPAAPAAPAAKPVKAAKPSLAKRVVEKLTGKKPAAKKAPAKAGKGK